MTSILLFIIVFERIMIPAIAWAEDAEGTVMATVIGVDSTSDACELQGDTVYCGRRK